MCIPRCTGITANYEILRDHWQTTAGICRLRIALHAPNVHARICHAYDLAELASSPYGLKWRTRTEMQANDSHANQPKDGAFSREHFCLYTRLCDLLLLSVCRFLLGNYSPLFQVPTRILSNRRYGPVGVIGD